MEKTKLKQARLALGLSQVEVSEALGISQAHLSRVERGEKTLSDDMLQRFADFYRVESSSLLEPQKKKPASVPSQVELLQLDLDLPPGLRELAEDVSIYALKITLAEWRMLRSIELPRQINKDRYVQLLLAIRGVLSS